MKDRHVLVVGGRTGIGLEIVQRLEALGCCLDVVGRADSYERTSPRIQYHACDLAREDGDFDFLPNQLNGVVYCPGTIRLKPLARLTEADFLEDWQTNLMGAVRVLQACQNC